MEELLFGKKSKEKRSIYTTEVLRREQMNEYLKYKTCQDKYKLFIRENNDNTSFWERVISSELLYKKPTFALDRSSNDKLYNPSSLKTNQNDNKSNVIIKEETVDLNDIYVSMMDNQIGNEPRVIIHPENNEKLHDRNDVNHIILQPMVLSHFDWKDSIDTFKEMSTKECDKLKNDSTEVNSNVVDKELKTVYQSVEKLCRNYYQGKPIELNKDNVKHSLYVCYLHNIIIQLTMIELQRET